ncbi:MAG: hypothetical protein HWN66_15810 [Candidatus Helarchaeota archaeon]|nr:hypothetical protein [Candidatus Helarchaeota archaeon]
MELYPWGVVAIVIGTLFALCVVFALLSRVKIRSLNKKSKPMPTQINLGPKVTPEHEDTEWSGIEKSRGMRGIGEVVVPLSLKTVVGFFDKVYIGETYACKIFLFNTAKNASQADTLIKGIMAKDEQKKFETDTLYAKDQEPVKVKIQIFGPNFTISPTTRTVEVPAGSLVVSTHLIAPKNDDPPMNIIGKTQTLLISFDQLFDESETHLGSIDYRVEVEKAIIPTEIESEITSQEKISYLSTAAGAATAILTILTTILALLGIP